MEWRETFSIGISGRHHHPYYQLPAGDYVFRVKTVTPTGESIGSEVAMPVSIPQVFWKRPSVLALAFILSAGSAAGIVRLQTHRRLRVALAHLEQQRTLNRERARIAQDIHDDLGASLTRVNLLSQSALGKIDPAHPAWQDAKSIGNEAVNVTQSLDEVVWAVSPRHDTLESLLNYLADFAGEFLEPAGVRARIHVPQPLPQWVLPTELRHNVVLAVKETLNNVVKHAQATEIHLRLELQADAFNLTIEDNGCGFDQTAAATFQSGRSTHPGLVGIKERIESLGGHFSLDSAPGRGTRITFTVPVPPIENEPI
jgi:signal transduction histidine kinase